GDCARSRARAERRRARRLRRAGGRAASAPLPRGAQTAFDRAGAPAAVERPGTRGNASALINPTTILATVTGDRRTEFIAWARRSRAKPAFDLEERDQRLAVAGAVRALIEAAHGGRPLREETDALAKRGLSSDVPLIAPGQLKQLLDWAETDQEGLGRALRDLAADNDA